MDKNKKPKIILKDRGKGRPPQKIMKLKKIKANVEKKKKKGTRSAAIDLKSNAFLEFNGMAATGSKDQVDTKKIEAFYMAKKTIKEWMKKDAEVDSKKVFALSKKLLDEEDLENAELAANYLKCFKYIALIGMLDARLNWIEESVLRGKRGEGDEENKNEKDYQNFKEKYKECLNKDGIEFKDEGMEMEEDRDELNEVAVEANKLINEWEAYGEDEWKEALKENGDRVEDDKKADKGPEEKKAEEDKPEDYDEEDNRVIEAYIKEVEKVDMKDSKLNEKFFDNLYESRLELKKSLKITEKNLENKEECKLSNEQITGLNSAQIKDLNNLNSSQSQIILNKLLSSSKSDEVSFLVVVIKSLLGKIDKLENVVKSLTSSLNKKVEIDEKHVVKEKGNIQMKKIFKDDYIPQNEWNKLSSVDKALHNVRDFAQYPKPSVWKNFKDEEKLEYFKQKLMWNKDRAKFLRLLAEGKEIPNELLKWKWNMNISLSRAITSNLYYGDKFSDGFRVKEFAELWKKSDKKLRNEANDERGKLKVVLKNLNNKKKINDAFVYVENWFVKIDGLYWDNNMDVLKEKARKRFENNRKYYNEKKFGKFLGEKRKADGDIPKPDEEGKGF